MHIYRERFKLHLFSMIDRSIDRSSRDRSIDQVTIKSRSKSPLKSLTNTMTNYLIYVCSSTINPHLVPHRGTYVRYPHFEVHIIFFILYYIVKCIMSEPIILHTSLFILNHVISFFHTIYIILQ